MICTVVINPDNLEFEWDKGNFDKSYKKHGISPEEAEGIFLDENLGIVPDIGHSETEKRLIALGKTKSGISLFIIFTIRKEKIRIISARRMHRKEVLKYEKAKKGPKI